MDPITAALVFGVILTAICVLYQNWHAPARYPPGPMALPIIGNLHQILLAGSLPKFLEDARKKYGNVYSIRFGGVTRVVIASYSLLHEVFVSRADNTSERTTNLFARDVGQELRKSPGMIGAPFPHWKTLRSFALNVLREEGMGKSSMEPKILDEAHILISTFLVPNEGKPFDFKNCIRMATSNIISGLVFGRRFDYNDTTFNKLTSMVESFLNANVKAGAANNVPLLRYLPGDITGSKGVAKTFSCLRETMSHFISEHKKALDRENPYDYIDHYLIQQEQENDPDTFFTDGNLVITVVQLFGAGTETTSTALRWAFLYMCMRPDVQAKVHLEIDAVIGTDREPTFKDRLLMPYTEAVFTEVLRISNIASQGVPRLLNKDMIIDGKAVPVGSELMMNLSSVMFDEQTFEDPHEFKPERYLGDGAKLKSRILPFGLGRRVCLGEPLARMEFFLFFTSILQKYTVSSTKQLIHNKPALLSFINSPQPYEAIFKPRISN